MDAKDIAEFIPFWRNEVYTCPSAIEVEGYVKVHSPVLGMIDRDRSLHICPLSDEIGEHLRLDSLVWPVLDGIGDEFDRPFNDVAIGFLVLEDIAKWVLSNNFYGVGLKVVAELSRCD